MQKKLLLKIDEQFNVGELEELCFMLDVDIDNLRGGTKREKARELIKYMDKRKRLPELVIEIKKVRPDLEITFDEKRRRFPWSQSAELDEKRARRHRPRMIDKVEKYWVQEVTTDSMGDREINLDLVERRIVAKQLKPRLHGRREWVREARGADIGIAFDESHQSLVILGEAGAGKSTLLRILARDRVRKAKEDENYPIPVLLFLSSWRGSKQTIKEWLVQELIEKYSVHRGVARTWVENGNLLLLLDGLDEVAKAHRESCVEALNNYHEEFDQVPIAICCRTADFEALPIDLKLHGAIKIEPLTAAHIEAYLERIGQIGVNLKILFQQDEALLSLAQTPLMLMTITIAYGSNPETAHLANNVDVGMRQQHLFNTFTEEMFKRDLHNLFPRQQTIRWLAWLADKMALNDDSMFRIEDLRPFWLDNGRQRFFFSAVVRLIPMILLFLAFVLGGQLAIIFESIFGEGNTDGFLVALIIGAICSFVMGLGSLISVFIPGKWSILITIVVTSIIAVIFGGVMPLPDENADIAFVLVGVLLGAFGGWLGNAAVPTRINVVEKLSFSWRQFLWGVPVSILIGFIFWWLSDYSIPDGASIGLLIGLIFGLVRGFRRSEAVESKIIPNQGIIWSGQNAVKVGVAVFLATLLSLFFGAGLLDPQDPTNGINFGLFLSVPVSFAFWFAFGGAAIIRHVVLRCILAVNGCLPWRLEAFLDYTDTLVLIRKVGGGYIFYHKLLQDYFAQLEEKGGFDGATIT